MGRPIGTQRRQSLRIQRLTALLQRMQPLGQPEDIKEDEAIGDEVIIFDDLPLLGPVITGFV